MTLLATFLLLAATLSPSAAAQEVRVREVQRGCYGESERESVWHVDGRQLVCGDRALPLVRHDELRRVILDAPELETLDADALLASVGVTREILAARRDRILAAALPAFRDRLEGLPELPAHLEPLLAWEALRQPMAAELLGKNWICTLHYELEVHLPGDPEIVLLSRGRTPWMLPWDIRVGERTWQSADVRISQALLDFVLPDGPCTGLLNGAAYWRDGFWNNENFWQRWVGRQLDAALASPAYAALDGWELASTVLRVDNVMTGNVNMQPRSMFFDLASRYPANIDELRWWNPLRGDEPTSSWHDVLGAWRAADEALQRESWIGEWKRSGPARTLGLEVVGARGVSETNLDLFVLPAWQHAGFTGEPDFQLLLRRDRTWSVTIYLARDQAGALIATARPGEGEHWLDALDFSFHPRGKPPTYGRVDAAGQFELRTLP